MAYEKECDDVIKYLHRQGGEPVFLPYLLTVFPDMKAETLISVISILVTDDLLVSNSTLKIINLHNYKGVRVTLNTRGRVFAESESYELRRKKDNKFITGKNWKERYAIPLIIAAFIGGFLLDIGKDLLKEYLNKYIHPQKTEQKAVPDSLQMEK